MESVSIRRALAVDRPDVYLPMLAASLHDLSVGMCMLDRCEESLDFLNEALNVWVRLAGERADLSMFTGQG